MFNGETTMKACVLHVIKTRETITWPCLIIVFCFVLNCFVVTNQHKYKRLHEATEATLFVTFLFFLFFVLSVCVCGNRFWIYCVMLKK